MPLSDLAVFSEYAYSAMTETIAQQIEVFNGASRGTIQLQAAAHQGDYSDKAFFQKVSGLVRRRNAYGSGGVAGVNLANLVDTMVKVAAGTPPVELNPGQFKWIQMNPEIAGAALGQQLAGDTLADMLNTVVMVGYSALSQVVGALGTGIVFDGTGVSGGLISPGQLNSAVSLFGDRGQDLLAWIMHSKPLYDYYGGNLANAQRLFNYGTVNVIQDPFGRVFVITDSPSLLTAGSPNTYHTLGLSAGSLRCDQNGDFTDNYQTINGQENIQRTYQAEWSYEVGVKGFAWDKATGGKSPSDGALGSSSNWNRYATSIKDLAGVVLETK